MSRIKIEDLNPQTQAKLGDAELNHVLGGIKDGTSNTFFVGESYAAAQANDSDARDYLVWQRNYGTR